MINEIFQKLTHRSPNLATGLGISIGSDSPAYHYNGPLNRRTTQGAGSQSKWHIGSISKSLTATLALQFSEKGQLDLAAPLSQYLKDAAFYHPEVRATNMRHLLSHTAGLSPNPPPKDMALWSDLPPEIGREKILKAYLNAPLPHPRGEHLYSNLGYMLAGHVMEQISGQSWEALIKTQIAAPLRLKSLGFGAPNGAMDPWGHRRSLFRDIAINPNDPSADNPAWLGPAGTLHMTLPDLLSYGQAHLKSAMGDHSGILSATSSRRMRAPIAAEYALGWVIRDGTFWHNGSNTMWYALLIMDTVSQSVIACVQNSFRNARRIDQAVYDIIAQLRA